MPPLIQEVVSLPFLIGYGKRYRIFELIRKLHIQRLDVVLKEIVEGIGALLRHLPIIAYIIGIISILQVAGGGTIILGDQATFAVVLHPGILICLSIIFQYRFCRQQGESFGLHIPVHFLPIDFIPAQLCVIPRAGGAAHAQNLSVLIGAHDDIRTRIEIPGFLILCGEPVIVIPVGGRVGMGQIKRSRILRELQQLHHAGKGLSCRFGIRHRYLRKITAHKRWISVLIQQKHQRIAAKRPQGLQCQVRVLLCLSGVTLACNILPWDKNVALRVIGDTL